MYAQSEAAAVAAARADSAEASCASSAAHFPLKGFTVLSAAVNTRTILCQRQAQSRRPTASISLLPRPRARPLLSRQRHAQSRRRQRAADCSLLRQRARFCRGRVMLGEVTDSEQHPAPAIATVYIPAAAENLVPRNIKPAADKPALSAAKLVSSTAN
eukprot:6189656-Pleurochrysis_carterae.AAC.1